jgi:hypothetical protein
MPENPDGIIVERTPMRDLARRLLELLHDSRIQAWIASQAAVEVLRGGACVPATAWNVTVPETYADRARRVIAQARRARRLLAQGPLRVRVRSALAVRASH